MDGTTEMHVGHVESPGAAALALLLLLLAFVGAVMAVRGTYLTVWEAIRPGGGASSASSGGASSSSGGGINVDNPNSTVPAGTPTVNIPQPNPTQL